MKNKFLVFVTIMALIVASILPFKGCTSKKNHVYNMVDSKKIETIDEVDAEVKETGGNLENKPDYISKNANIINEAKEYSVKASDVSKIINQTYENTEKMVFLTFDDGPSEGTKEILDILDKENINATFFVLGNVAELEESSKIIKDTVSRGNAIANHTYTHNYKTLYPTNSVDVNYFIQEIEKTNNILKSILGQNFDTKVIRMPGGYMSRKYYSDKNLEALDISLSNKGLVQIDWTSENGDGLNINENVEEMVQRVKTQTQYQNHIVLLMHDSNGKNKTIKALPEIIKHFKENLYSFKVIANDNIK